MQVVLLLVISLLTGGGAVYWLFREQLSFAERAWGLLGLLPTGAIALFYAFVGRAYLALGVWPSPYHPDPKDLAFDLHHLAVSVSVPVVMASAVVLGGAFVWLWRNRSPKSRLGGMAAGYLVTLVAWFGLMVLDPGNYFYWFMD